MTGRLAFSLSLVAGLTDVTTFVLLGGVFSAHITGNLVSLAADLARHQPPGVTTLLAIPCFIVVAAVASGLVTRSARPPAWWATPLLITQFVLLAAAGALSMTAHASTDHDGGAAIGTGLLAIAAMAVQNALLHLTFTRTPSTAVMTGNLVTATVAAVRILLRDPDQQRDRATWQATWPLLAGFFAGCLGGAVACGLLDDRAWLLPMIAALLVAVVFAGRRWQ